MKIATWNRENNKYVCGFYINANKLIIFNIVVHDEVKHKFRRRVLLTQVKTRLVLCSFLPSSVHFIVKWSLDDVNQRKNNDILLLMSRSNEFLRLTRDELPSVLLSAVFMNSVYILPTVFQFVRIYFPAGTTSEVRRSQLNCSHHGLLRAQLFILENQMFCI